MAATVAENAKETILESMLTFLSEKNQTAFKVGQLSRFVEDPNNKTNLEAMKSAVPPKFRDDWCRVTSNDFDQTDHRARCLSQMLPSAKAAQKRKLEHAAAAAGGSLTAFG